MSNLLSKLWPVLLAIYIISPIDAHPLFFDDILASVILFYIIYKNSKQKQHFKQYTSGSSRNSRNSVSDTSSPLTLNEAYKILGVQSGSSYDEITRAYKDKIVMSHPDKVSHLSIELQEKAKELTLQLNEAFDLIKKSIR